MILGLVVVFGVTFVTAAISWLRTSSENGLFSTNPNTANAPKITNPNPNPKLGLGLSSRGSGAPGYMDRDRVIVPRRLRANGHSGTNRSRTHALNRLRIQGDRAKLAGGASENRIFSAQDWLPTMARGRAQSEHHSAAAAGHIAYYVFHLIIVCRILIARPA